MKKYYCDSSFTQEDKRKWIFLLKTIIPLSDEVCFNALFKNYKDINEIAILAEDLIFEGKIKNKIYSSGISLKYKLSSKLQRFIKSKLYGEWYNYHLEDISFFANGKEILATITHENHIIMLLDEKERMTLNNEGLNFDEAWNGR